MGANDEYLFQDQPFVKSLWYGGIKIFWWSTFKPLPHLLAKKLLLYLWT
jgi:hypothetical protein